MCQRTGVHISIYINGKDKVDICIQNKIDIMIDDSYYNYYKLINNGIKTILFDEHNRYKDVNKKIGNWSELINVLENIKLKEVRK